MDDANDNKKRTHQQAFVASMTFASSAHVQAGCDCDECGRPSSGTVIPNAIAEALERYRRQQPKFKRIQDRVLLKRYANVSVWEVTLPLAAEPLVEYGSSQRLVWIKQLAETSRIQTIGEGIIGSGHEEKGRTVLDWRQGQVWWVPSQGGKAVGWVHVPEDEKTSGYASLVVTKIPSEENDQSNDEAPSWVAVLRKACREANRAKEDSKSYQLDDTTSKKVIEALS